MVFLVELFGVDGLCHLYMCSGNGQEQLATEVHSSQTLEALHPCHEKCKRHEQVQKAPLNRPTQTKHKTDILFGSNILFSVPDA